MTSDMKSILFAFIIIITFSEGKLQSWQNSSFLQNNFLNLFFPKELGLVKVRRMDQIKGINDAKVLDFVSKKFFLIKFIRILYLIYY